MTAVPLDCAPFQAPFQAPFSAPLPASLAGTWTTATATPSPSPTLPGNLEPGDVSPGLIGFLPVFLIALASIGLFLSLTKKLRGVNRRQAQIDAEEAAASSAGAPAGGKSAGGPSAGGPSAGGPSADETPDNADR